VDMSRIVFPYGIRFREDGRVETFPAIEVSILGNNGNGLRTVFHIDSGATTSLLPAGDARALGIVLDRNKKVLIRGITGKPLVGFRHIVAVDFGELEVKVPAVFMEADDVPRILGREIIFERFAILFDEFKKRTLFLERRGESRIIDKLFLT